MDFRVRVFGAEHHFAFNNISVILWQSVL